MTEQNTAQTHYTLLQVTPNASPQEIRRAYRDLSKLYHPDTTTLPAAIATEKFKILNDAYATLSNPEQRTRYDYSIGISRVAVIQAPAYLNRPASERRKYENSNAYLDPTDRPLSPGELFALFILGVTFVGCLILVVAISWTKGEIVFHSSETDALLSESASTLVETQELPPVQQLPLAPPLLDLPTPTVPTPQSPPDAAGSAADRLPFDNLSSKII
jgi:hypothetical protein